MNDDYIREFITTNEVYELDDDKLYCCRNIDKCSEIKQDILDYFARHKEETESRLDDCIAMFEKTLTTELLFDEYDKDYYLKELDTYIGSMNSETVFNKNVYKDAFLHGLAFCKYVKNNFTTAQKSRFVNCDITKMFYINGTIREWLRKCAKAHNDNREVLNNDIKGDFTETQIIKDAIDIAKLLQEYLSNNWIIVLKYSYFEDPIILDEEGKNIYEP